MSPKDQTKQPTPIFISSTREDLIEYREAVKEVLHRLEMIVRGMEYFGSKPGNPKDECLRVVASCRLYIGIFAMRYGSVETETGKSMTQLELEEAVRLKLPILIYMLDEGKQPLLPKYVDTGHSAERLKALKEDLKRKFVVSFFTTPEDLAKRVSQDVPQLLNGIDVGAGLHDRGDQNGLRKVYSVALPRTMNVVGQCEGMLRDMAKTGGHDFDRETIQLADVERICRAVDPNGAAPLVVGGNPQDGWKYATWLGYLCYWRDRSRQFDQDIRVFSAFLEPEHIALLALVEQCSYFRQLDALRGMHVRSRDFSWIASSIWDYFKLTKDLERYVTKIKGMYS